MKSKMRIIIVTGMSGGGKSTAIHMLEDAGFYCVDNMPPSLLEKFAELLAMPGSDLNKVALGIDVRSGQQFEAAPAALHSLKEKGYPVEILFMDCSDSVLVKRYKETRRIHPLQFGHDTSSDSDIAQGERLEDGIRRERQLLSEIRSEADYVVDTSQLLSRELRGELNRLFLSGDEYKNLMITVLSFGFKHGIPEDADLVFDVRFLPNPFYVERLKLLTGLDKEVKEFVNASEESGIFLDKLTDMLRFLIPGYIKEGKNQLVIAIGCTGGQHRSVVLAEDLYERLKCSGEYGCNIAHRDCGNNAAELAARYR